MKNPANPGDFGTNGIRGVVLSGMSETTNSADWPIGVSVSITQTCGKPASEFEMLTHAWYALGAKMRAAEGGVERETTNSPAEIGGGCTGRKNVLARWFLWATHFAGALLLVCDLGFMFGLVAYAACASLGFLIGKLWISGWPRACGGGIR